MKRILFIIIISVFAACGSGFGHKLKSEKLEIYFDDKKLEPYADSLGKYWTKNQFVGSRKQSLKITASKGIFEVRIIKSPEFLNAGLSPKENFLLDSLRADISLKIFNKNPTSLVICDANFKSIIQFKP